MKMMRISLMQHGPNTAPALYCVCVCDTEIESVPEFSCEAASTVAALLFVAGAGMCLWALIRFNYASVAYLIWCLVLIQHFERKNNFSISTPLFQ